MDPIYVLINVVIILIVVLLSRKKYIEEKDTREKFDKYLENLEATYSPRPSSPYRINEDNHFTMGDTIITKVVGVTFENRQEIIRGMSIGDCVQLVQDPENIYDKYAVMVLREDGERIGYIKKEITAGVNMYIDRIKPVTTLAEVLDIIGDPEKGQNLGVVIEITPPTEGELMLSSEMRYPRMG